ncbi:MAG: polysaccharide deacetylase family protein, partial [Acidobacteriota bacterium]
IRVSLVGQPALMSHSQQSPVEHENPQIMRELCLTRASLGRKVVLLTFDGGGNDNATTSILRTLKREHIHATMFLTGEYMRHYPDLVRQIVAAGNTVGNHTFSHPHLTTYRFNGRQETLPGVSGPFVESQLKRADVLFKQLTGRNMAPYWRAPFGEYNRQILEWGALAGYRSVYWTEHLDTLDWVADRKSPLFHTPENVLERLIGRSKRAPYGINGGVILMHLGTERNGSSRIDLILPSLIDRLKKEGYSFTTVDKTAWGREPAPRPSSFEAAGTRDPSPSPAS